MEIEHDIQVKDFSNNEWKFLIDTYELYVGEIVTKERVAYILNATFKSTLGDDFTKHQKNMNKVFITYAYENGLENENVKWEFINKLKRIIYDETGEWISKPELNSLTQLVLEVEKKPLVDNEEFEDAQVIQNEINELLINKKKSEEVEKKIRNRKE